MTRDQAIHLLHRNTLRAPVIDRSPVLETRANVAGLVDSLIALGVLKVEQPRTPTLEAMNIAVRFTQGPRDLNEMFHEFEQAGLKIVRADGSE